VPLRRFAPQSPTEVYDPAAGIREFVVGTGGQSLQGFPTPKPLSEVRLKNFGVLRLTLHSSSYDWQFIRDTGALLDSGSGACRSVHGGDVVQEEDPHGPR